MTRKLTLYIGNKAVDLSDDSLVVMNYTAEELSNPTIVKNSYSQQITLPATPNNNDIFGNIYRLDRSIMYSGGYTGIGFNPLVRTPFQIFDDLGQIVESGYVKLDAIKRNGTNITYSISLYGGLGSFFYSLSYNDEGDKLTLADLEYLDGAKGELDFNINAANVNEAWNGLKNGYPDGEENAKWAVINFAPTYSGIPDNFDADKAIAYIGTSGTSAFGMPTSQSADGKTYKTIDGYTLINFGKAHSGDELRELRSYLQRPVVSMKRIFEGIRRLAKRKGFTLSLDGNFFSESNPYYNKTWMLLPPMTDVELKTDKKTGSLSGGNGELVESRNISLKISQPFGGGATTIKATASMSAYGIWIESDKRALEAAGGIRFTRPGGTYNICCVMQLVVVTTDGTRIGSNLVCVMDNNTSATGHTLVSNMIRGGFSPVGSPSTTECRGYYRYIASEDRFEWYGDNPSFEMSVNNAKSAYLAVTWNQSQPTLYIPHYGVDAKITWDDAYLRECFVDVSGTFEVSSFVGARTGSLFTKQNLLKTQYTPIDYLLSFAKTFGLLFSYNKATNEVKLQQRDEWYANGQIVDISDRIDYSQAIEITPNKIDSRYLEFSNESEGAFVEELESQSGRPYASKRIDTGSAFNKETKIAIENNTFKGAAEVLGRSRYYNRIMQGGKFVPSVFTDATSKYTLYYNGEAKEFDVTAPNTSASVIPFNENFPTYDVASFVQLHDKENKPLDLSDVLVFYSDKDWIANTDFGGYRLTDDNGYMSTLNEGKPCWILDPTNQDAPNALVPRFCRYMMSGNEITHSLDFGIPEQIDIPYITHRDGVDIYYRGWRNFLTDQYNANTRIVRAKVDLRGYQVGENLLRNFYYFENSYWVMNRIINYSLTSDAPVECEFIKVQNIDNYNNGQNYN